MKRTLNRAKNLNKTCEITTCVSRDWPPCLSRIQIPQKRAVIRPPAELHLMVLVALESISVKYSLNFRGIPMGLYRGWRWGGGGEGGGGALCPSFPWRP